MPVNAGVLNFFGNLLQGFTEGRQQAQEQQERKEYKKLLMKQMQAEFDAKEAQAQAVIDWQKNPSDPILGMKAGVFKEPTDALLFQIFGGQPQQQQQLPPSIGMNYEEPTTPVVEQPVQQPTFSAQNTMGIDIDRLLEKRLYGTTTNPNDIIGSDILWDEQNKRSVRVPRDRRKYRWDLAEPVPIGYEVQKIEQELPSGGKTVEFTHIPKIPGLGPSPQAVLPAQKKTPPIAQFENQEAGYRALLNQIDLDASRGLTLSQFINKYAPPTENDTNKYLSFLSQSTGFSPETKLADIPTQTVAQAITRFEGVRPELNNPGGLRAAGQPGVVNGKTITKPGIRSMYLNDEELAKYIDVNTGKRPQGKMSQDDIEASGQYVRKPEKMLGTEEASKLANGIVAMETLPLAISKMLPDGKTLDKSFAQKLWTWNKSPELMANSEVAPYGKIIKQAIEAQVRLESGAAVPETEIKRKIDTNVNQFFSSAESVATGLGLLQNTLGSTVEMADPTGYYRAIGKKGRQPLSPGKAKLSLKVGGTLDAQTAKSILQEAGGDKNKARDIARQRGYKF